MNADVEKAVERMVASIYDHDCQTYRDIKLIEQALRDQEAEIANLERRRSHEHIVAENALTLLRECDAVARRRGDKCGLCDSIDNDGQPYQSAHLAAHLGGEQ